MLLRNTRQNLSTLAQVVNYTCTTYSPFHITSTCCIVPLTLQIFEKQALVIFQALKMTSHKFDPF